MITTEGGNLAVGLIVGASVATIVLLALEVVDLPFELNESLVASLSGGAIAAIAAFGAQSLAMLDGATKEERRRFQLQRTLVQSLYFKILATADHLQKLNNYYRTFEPENYLYMNGDPVLVKTILSPPFTLTVTTEEKASILTKDSISLVNDLSDLERSMDVVNSILRVYEQKFSSIQEMLHSSALKSFEGKLISAEISVDKFKILEAVDVLDNLQSLVGRASLLGIKTLDEVVAHLNEKFDLGLELNIKLDLPGHQKSND